MKLALQPLNMEDIELVDEMYNDEAVFKPLFWDITTRKAACSLKGNWSLGLRINRKSILKLWLKKQLALRKSTISME